MTTGLQPKTRKPRDGRGKRGPARGRKGAKWALTMEATSFQGSSDKGGGGVNVIEALPARGGFLLRERNRETRLGRSPGKRKSGREAGGERNNTHTTWGGNEQPLTMPPCNRKKKKGVRGQTATPQVHAMHGNPGGETKEPSQVDYGPRSTTNLGHVSRVLQVLKRVLGINTYTNERTKRKEVRKNAQWIQTAASRSQSSDGSKEPLKKDGDSG